MKISLSVIGDVKTSNVLSTWDRQVFAKTKRAQLSATQTVALLRKIADDIEDRTVR